MDVVVIVVVVVVVVGGLPPQSEFWFHDPLTKSKLLVNVEGQLVVSSKLGIIRMLSNSCNSFSFIHSGYFYSASSSPSLLI